MLGESKEELARRAFWVQMFIESWKDQESDPDLNEDYGDDAREEYPEYAEFVAESAANTADYALKCYDERFSDY